MLCRWKLMQMLPQSRPAMAKRALSWKRAAAIGWRDLKSAPGKFGFVVLSVAVGVAALVGGRARMMWVSTFHSACVRILRAEHQHAGLKSTFSIYDADDSRRLMQLVARELDLDPKRHPARMLAAQVSNLKNELIDAETATVDAKGPEQRTVAEAYTLYQRRLRESQALDFDDLIMGTVHLFRSHPDVAEHYRRRFRHVLVDENQDTNHAQYVLVRELVGPPGGPVPPAEPKEAELVE